MNELKPSTKIKLLISGSDMSESEKKEMYFFLCELEEKNRKLDDQCNVILDAMSNIVMIREQSQIKPEPYSNYFIIDGNFNQIPENIYSDLNKLQKNLFENGIDVIIRNISVIKKFIAKKRRGIWVKENISTL